MLFLAYWELNENVSEQARSEGAQKIMSGGLFPPQGVNVLRWDGTPDGWGVLLLEAEKAEDVFRAIAIWRSAVPGFFKSIKTSPAMPIQEIIPLVNEVTQSLG